MSSESSRAPNRFVSLHNHTGQGSPFDGLGYPKDHFEWCIENGISAHALTEHGNMNSLAYAQLLVDEWHKGDDGLKKAFKYVPGIEAYYHPDLDAWRDQKRASEEAKTVAQAAKKARKSNEKVVTPLIVVPAADGSDETEQIEVGNALTLENEDDTKSNKLFNPLNRRHHLVMLPKNSEGLKDLFAITSSGYIDGFYRFPRIDAKVIKEYNKKKNIIASGACLGGFPSWSIFQVLQGIQFDQLHHTLVDDPVLFEKCIVAVGNCYESMVDIFGAENYFLELQFNRLPAQNLVNRVMLEFCKREGLNDKLIVTCDAHYYRPERWRERELYKKLGFMNYKEFGPDSIPKSITELKCELYPKNHEQIWKEYETSRSEPGAAAFYEDSVVCDAIERAYDLAHEVIGEPKVSKTIKLPRKGIVPEGLTPFQHLVKLCKLGMFDRGLANKPEYIARLKEELEVMKALDVAEYFITMQRIIALSRGVCLVGCARGSGGGSLVNYVLRITDLDPIRWDLPFSRFMSIYRVGLPDIDSDLADRDKVLEELRKEFGYTNVVPISNYNVLKVKSLVRDLSKFYSIPLDEVSTATRTVEQEVRAATMKEGDDKNLFVLTYEEAMIHSPSFRSFMETYPDVASSMQALFKENRSLGRHAGGVLVADDLRLEMPLITSKGEPQTPWVEGVATKQLEKVGNYIKFDLLGLETLRLIEMTIEYILRRRRKITLKEGDVLYAAPGDPLWDVRVGDEALCTVVSSVEEPLKDVTFADIKKWYDENLDIDVIDLEDQRVYEYVYHEGHFSAVFQCSSDGARQFFLRAKPRSIVDIAALTSIYRPGPLAAKVDELWTKHEHEPYDWGHPLVNETLAKTRGLLVFQESVMALANKVAGYPMEKCDEVRRAIMKRSISGGEAAKAKVKELTDSFVNGCIGNGLTKAQAEKTWETVCFMSGYGFNASHAIAYAFGSYLCAFLHTHFEEEWLGAHLKASSNNPRKKSAAITDLRGMGYSVVDVDVNYASMDWTILPDRRYMPSLTSCKDVGAAAVQELLSMRPFFDVVSMLWDENYEWRFSKFNKKALSALIKVKAFASLDCVGPDKLFGSWKQMHHVIVDCIDEIKKTSKRDQMRGVKRFLELVQETSGMDEWTRREFAEHAVSAYGAIDVGMLLPKSTFDGLDARGVRSIDRLEQGENDVVWFVVSGVEVKTTKTGKPYLSLSVQGLENTTRKLFCWGYKPEKDCFEPLDVCVAEVESGDFGLSTTCFKVKHIALRLFLALDGNRPRMHGRTLVWYQSVMRDR